MVNVLIVGATGYIGQSVVQSLVTSGQHRVFGLARTPAKAKQLACQEVIPILGSISENAELLKAIDEFHISTVVDVAGAYQESGDLLVALKAAGKKSLQAAASSGTRCQKLGLIYISGMWVHGSSDIPVDDLTPVGVPSAPAQPAQMVNWRPQLEQDILAASEVLNTMVIRAALTYGRSSSLWSMFFAPLHGAAQSGAKSVSLAAEPDGRPGLVHVDDVASGVRCAVEKLPLISGTGVYPIFGLVTSQESMRDLLEAAGRVLGYRGEVKFVGAGDDIFAQAMSMSLNANSGRAKQILGWEPARGTFLQGMDVFAKAWEAGMTK